MTSKYAHRRAERRYLEVGYAGQPKKPGSLLRCLSGHIAPTARGRWERFISRLGQPRSHAHAEATTGEVRLRRANELASAVAAICEPFVLIVDSLQFFDEVSVELLLDLCRVVAGKHSEDQSPLRIVVGYREEGISADLLREMTELLFEGDRRTVITLGPLGARESQRLFEQR